MSGLLQRAAQYRANQRKLRLVKADSIDEMEELGGTPEERLEIIEHIDEVINGNQLEITSDTFRVRARKRGVGLPLLVNLLAVLLVVAGAYAIVRVLGEREDTVASEATTVSSTEGVLLRQLREESDAQLAAKNSEIAGIEDRLSQMSAERAQLETSINSQLATQEDALRGEFQAALLAERERLEDGGLSEEEVNQRLAEFQATREEQYGSELEAIRAEARQELADREAILTSLITDAQQSLADAESERLALEDQLQEQEARLSAEFASREAELTEERAAAVNLLSELQARQEQEQLALDQIVSLYAGVQDSLAAGDLEAALAGTTALRGYLSDSAVATLPTVQRRRGVELFLVETLEARIEDEQRAASPDVASLAESALIISQVTETVALAEAAYGAADMEAARTLYLAAMAEIPAIAMGYERLTDLAYQTRADDLERTAAHVQRGNSLYLSGSYQDAATAYGDALATLPSADTSLLSRILDAGYQLRRTADLQALRAVQAELAEVRDELGETRTQLANAQATRDADESDVAEVRAELFSAQSRLETAQADLSTAESDLSASRAELAFARGELADSQGELADAREELASARGMLSSLQDELDNTRAGVVALETELETLRAEPDVVQTVVETVTETVADPEQAARIAELETELEIRGATVVELQTDLQEQQGAVAELQTEVAALELDMAGLRTNLADSRTENDRLTTTVTSLSPYEEFAREQRQLSQDILRYQQRFVSDSSAVAAGASSLELLEAKLLILRIIGSDSVRSEYPELADQLNDYLDALVVEQRREARAETLAEINDVLNYLLARTGAGSATSAAGTPPGLDETGAEGVRFFLLLRSVTGSTDTSE